MRPKARDSLGGVNHTTARFWAISRKKGRSDFSFHGKKEQSVLVIVARKYMATHQRQHNCIHCNGKTPQVFVGKRIVKTKWRDSPFTLWECLLCGKGNGTFVSLTAYNIYPDIFCAPKKKEETTPEGKQVFPDLPEKTGDIKGNSEKPITETLRGKD